MVSKISSKSAHDEIVNEAAEGQFDDAEEDDQTKANILRNHAALFGLNFHSANKTYSDEEEESDDSYDSDDDLEIYTGHVGPNCQRKPELQQQNEQTVDDYYKKFASKVNVEKFEGVQGLTSSASNRMISANKKASVSRQKVKDKQDRATVEQVMDPRTRMILFKLISNQKILSIDGCISTGKEANVYHATGPENISYAIKIYKTSILTFKARDKYVTGDFRFRTGYCRKNPRKMVRTWAEKEFRNLSRIHTAKTILVPCPRILKSHVLVMDFIGTNGWPSPLLQDVKFDLIDFTADHLKEFDVSGDNGEGNESSKESSNAENHPVHRLLKKLYRDCLVILYRLFRHCRLVHADFSEFNLILKDSKDLYVIDVSQSVEHDHPRSLDFLRSDMKNVQVFFGKRGVLVGDDKSLFDFITSQDVDDTNCDKVLDNILSSAKKFEEFNVGNEVFRQTFIPQKMNEVQHFERDILKAKKGEIDLIYANILGLKSDLSGTATKLEVTSLADAPSKKDKEPVKIKPINKDDGSKKNNKEGSQGKPEVDEKSEDESDSDSDGSSNEENEEGSHFKNSARPRDETAEEKRERKKAVKQEKASKRENKMKKHIKKRKEKLAHPNSKR